MRRTLTSIRQFIGLFVVAATLLLLAARLSAQNPVTLHVDGVVGTIATGTTCPAPRTSAVYATVQAAVNCAKDGDTLFIEDGVYTENLVIQRDLTLEGEGLDMVTLDGGGVGRVLTLQDGVTVDFSHLTIRGGQAESGAGIYSPDSTVYLTDVLLTNNISSGRGGGIYSQAGTVTIRQSQILANTAAAQGGAIASDAGTIILEDSLIAQNSAASGGGLFTAAGFVNISNSTLSGNVAGDGAGLYTDSGTVTLNNVTIATNSASAGTGGIRNLRARVNLSNTLIADNGAADCGGRLTSLGFNLVQNVGGDCVLAGDAATTLTGVSALLGGLADNGGAMLTHALQENSPAIDAGNPAVDRAAACTPLDARGWLRVWDDGGRCDVGAYEDNALRPGNTPPLVENDYYITGFDEPLTVMVDEGILVNDSDPDGDTLVFTLRQTTTHGILTLNDDGSFVYTPEANFGGEDFFTYRLYDGNVWQQARASILVSELAVKVLSPRGLVLRDYGNPIYEWITMPGAVYFYLVLEDINTGQTIINDTIAAADYCVDNLCSIDLTRLHETYRLVPGDYRWFIRAWSRAAAGPIIGPIKFTLQAEPPGLVTPLDATETDTYRPTLHWSLEDTAVNATYFQVAVLYTADLPGPITQTLLFETFSRIDLCGGIDGTACALQIPVDMPNNIALSAFIQNIGPGGALTTTGPYDNGYAGPIAFTPTVPIPDLPDALQVNYGHGLPTFTWNDDPTATQYAVFIGFVPNWQEVFSRVYTRSEADCDGIICQVQPQIVIPNGLYNFAVQGRGAGGNSIGGTYNNGYGVLENQILNLPIPLAPSTGFAPTGNILTRRPTLTWESVANAISYQVRVRGVSAPADAHLQWYWASDVNCLDFTGTCSITPPLNLTAGSYIWNVRAYGPGGISLWAEVVGISFSVGGTLPNRVSLLAPNGTVHVFSPTFSWIAVTNADYYQIWVGDPAVTTSYHYQWHRAEDVCVGVTCSLQLASLTLTNEDYLWNVQAATPAGVGAWTAGGMAFTVNVPFPAAPLLLSPVYDAIVFATNRPTFSWSTVANSQGYYLEVTNGAGSVVYGQVHYSTDSVCSANSCTVQLPAAIPYGGYRWRVIPGNLNGAGTSSPSRKFLSLSVNTQPMMAQADDALITRTGSWVAANEINAFGENVLISGLSGDTLSLIFTGTQVDLIYLTGPEFGTFAIEVDGMITQIVSTTAAQRSYGQIMTVNRLNLGVHSLRIIVQSGQIAVDAITVDGQLSSMVTPIPIPTEMPIATPTPEATPEITAIP